MKDWEPFLRIRTLPLQVHGTRLKEPETSSKSSELALKSPELPLKAPELVLKDAGILLKGPETALGDPEMALRDPEMALKGCFVCVLLWPLCVLCRLRRRKTAKIAKPDAEFRKEELFPLSKCTSTGKSFALRAKLA